MHPRNFAMRVHTKVALGQARELLHVLHRDQNRLRRIDAYARGHQDDPYRPESAGPEYMLLAKRAVTNVMSLIVSAPGQSLAIDSIRRGGQAGETERRHWRSSNLATRQATINRAALTYGHAFAVTEQHPLLGVQTRALSPMRTTALFDDPVNDIDPVVALTVDTWPEIVSDGSDKPREIPGRARMWTRTHKYEVHWSNGDGAWPDPKKVRIGKGRKHRNSRCPVTRFLCHIDIEGRTTGLVEPMMPLQDRINQTVFDLLIAQTFGSFNVRTATGMAPPMLTKPRYANPDDPTSEIIGRDFVLDADGNRIPAPIDHNAARFLFAESPDAKFSSLPGTPLNGYIEALDLAFRHLAALAQVPPHHLLGQAANLSAEALTAAEAGFLRLLGELKQVLSGPWLRVLRLAAELEGDAEAATAEDAEVIWRDVENRSLAAVVDALGKLPELLDVPKRGLWGRIPNVSSEEISYWEELSDTEEDSALQRRLNRAQADRMEAEVEEIEARTAAAEAAASRPVPELAATQ